MNKIKDETIKKLYKRIDKYWIGHIYGYLIFILFVSVGIIIGYRQLPYLEVIATWTCLITFIACYPIVFIRAKASMIRKKEREELVKEVKDNEKNE